MINSVSSATHAQAVTQTKAAPQQPALSKPQPAHTDSVQISAAALALKEAIENPVQTAKEAASGDAQARRLLAREAANKVV
ncbi:MAG TPA: hypothetical protein VNX26_14075 [Candidatus Acidoferrum sp.]|jgi:hypothetical protein|nr:hypothetical protein [Candidatus Acidoferrum sp.]